MSIALALTAALLAQSPSGEGQLAYRQQAVVTGDAVALADVADLSALPPALRARASGLVVARFRQGQGEMAIQPARLAEKVGALMPALASRLPRQAAPILVKRQAPPASAMAPANCLAAKRGMSAGDTPGLGDFQAVSCGAAAPATAFRYDAALGAARLTRDLEAGEAVVGPPASTLAGVRAGQTLTLVVQVGPVRLERHVVAARSSGLGQPVFVYGDDGKVFSAPAPGASQ